MRIYGNDNALNNFLDGIDYVSGVEILSRRDITPYSGELAIQLRAHAKPKVIALAQKHGLSLRPCTPTER